MGPCVMDSSFQLKSDHKKINLNSAIDVKATKYLKDCKGFGNSKTMWEKWDIFKDKGNDRQESLEEWTNIPAV